MDRPRRAYVGPTRIVEKKLEDETRQGSSLILRSTSVCDGRSSATWHQELPWADSDVSPGQLPVLVRKFKFRRWLPDNDLVGRVGLEGQEQAQQGNADRKIASGDCKWHWIRSACRRGCIGHYNTNRIPARSAGKA